MVRFRCSPNADSYLIDDWIPQWLTNHEAWEVADNSKPPLAATLDGQQYYGTDWRFAWGSNSESVLMDNLVAYTQSYAPWHYIGYHVCNHDESGDSQCPPWDDSHSDVSIYTNGTVPTEVMF